MKTKLFFISTLVGISCLPVYAAEAATLSLKDCDGFSLAAQELEDGQKLNFEVLVSSTEPGSVSLKGEGTREFSSQSKMIDGKAQFSNVEAGSYLLCPTSSGKAVKVTFLQSKRQYAGLIAGLGGAAAVVGIAEGVKSSDGGTSDSVGAGPLPSVEGEPQAPVVDDTGSVPGVGCPPGSSKGSKGGDQTVSILGSDGCGTDLEPQPLSPYR